VVTVHLGAARQFKPRKESQCESTLAKQELHFKQFFLFVSTLEPRKNLQRLLNAYSHYRHQNIDGLPLVLIGSSGWQLESFSELLNALVAKGWVKNLGYVDDQTLAELYASARALLFPSIYEGFGLPVLEAMQSGTAVLTSRDSAMTEIAGGNSLLVNPRSELEIEQGITKLHNDLEFVSTLEFNGAQRAKDFSWKKCGNEMIQHYQKLK
jgi:alpha-1,3-rhamnosyl/mannosyltransferase